MKDKIEILVVDDDATHRLMLRAVLSDEGYEVTEAQDGAEAVEMLKQTFFDLVLMDVRMKVLGGLEALEIIKTMNPAIPVIIMTAYASIETARQSLKGGAYDYLTKPLDIDEMKNLITRALEHYHLKTENILLKGCLAERSNFSSILGTSQKMQELFEVMAMVAPTEATVLIYGESGTGKELVANAIHQNSARTGRIMVKVNCAALPETLLESELFGHEKGAFTGAIARKEGRFMVANGGTIFLDEVSEMSLVTQAKLLRVLQEREFDRIGGTRTIQVDVRVLAATNKDLEELVKSGKFREDLYYRLNVVPVTIPPLRERAEDISLLAEHFFQLYSERNNRPLKGFLPKTLDLMNRYNWPGNVRELENAIERAVILSRGDYIAPRDLPLAFQQMINETTQDEESLDMRSGRNIREVEKELIVKTLKETGGNRTKAAELLGFTRRTLQNKLKKYRIS